MNTKAGRKFFRFNQSPATTILLPSDWCMVGYKFRKLKAPQTVNVFNHAMINGRFTYAQLLGTPAGTVFKTAYTGRTMRRTPLARSVELRVGTRIQGPRTQCECLTIITTGDVYVGPKVAVHAVSCLLTPADYKGGPFGRPGLGPGNGP